MIMYVIAWFAPLSEHDAQKSKATFIVPGVVSAFSFGYLVRALGPWVGQGLGWLAPYASLPWDCLGNGEHGITVLYMFVRQCGHLSINSPRDHVYILIAIYFLSYLLAGD